MLKKSLCIIALSSSLAYCSGGNSTPPEPKFFDTPTGREILKKQQKFYSDNGIKERKNVVTDLQKLYHNRKGQKRESWESFYGNASPQRKAVIKSFLQRIRSFSPGSVREAESQLSGKKNDRPISPGITVSEWKRQRAASPPIAVAAANPARAIDTRGLTLLPPKHGFNKYTRRRKKN